MQKLLVGKNDFVEFVCKIRGHVVPEEDARALRSRPDEALEAACKRCNFPILLEADPEDKNAYWVSDTD